MNLVKAVIIIIKNKKGKYFVHQRNSTKKTSPNLFGLGAGGHIEEGETKEEAAKRELFEETGLKTELRYLFHKTYVGNEFTNEIDVFEAKTDLEKLETDNGEWQWCGWMSKNEVDKLLREDKLCPDTAEVYKTYLTKKILVFLILLIIILVTTVLLGNNFINSARCLSGSQIFECLNTLR